MEKIEEPKISLPKYIKKFRKIRAILYNWKTADEIEAGFSLNKRAKRAFEISNFKLSQLGLCEKLFLHFFNVFHFH